VQPTTSCPGCVDEATIALAQDPEPDYATAVLALVAAVALFLLFDYLVLKRVFRKPTSSQGTQHYSKKWAWFRWIGVGVLAVLGWHLFFGFP